MIVEKNFNWGVDLSLGNEMKFDEIYSYGKGGKKIILSEFLKEFFLHFGLEYALVYVYSFLDFGGFKINN